MKKIKFAIIVLVALAVFCVGRDFLLKSLIGTVAGTITGAPVHVGGLSLSVLRQRVSIANLRVYNPQGFPKDILVDIPRVTVAWDLGAILRGKLHLRELDIEIRELGLVKNKDGAMNVESLKIVAEKKPEDKAGKKPAKQMPIEMDQVNLAMGRVVNKDYSVEGSPVIKVYDVNLKKSYRNITSAQQLAALIVAEPVKQAGIQGLKTYGAAMVAGVAVLPVAVAFTFAGKDFARDTLGMPFDQAYDAALQAMRGAGAVDKEDKGGGVISAAVNGSRVTLQLKKLSANSTEVTVSARRFGFPQPEVASGVLYRLQKK